MDAKKKFESNPPKTNDKSGRKNSIYLKNLPAHYNKDEALSGFFRKFG